MNKLGTLFLKLFHKPEEKHVMKLEDLPRYFESKEYDPVVEQYIASILSESSLRKQRQYYEEKLRQTNQKSNSKRKYPPNYPGKYPEKYESSKKRKNKHKGKKRRRH